MTTRTATSIGLIAILLWSMLALFTAATGRIPPFQLNAMTFLIGGLVGVVSWIVRPQGLKALRQKPVVWALGIGGLFGYHALYFAALRLAPPAESGLINYLWPLLIVLFSSLLPGEHLRRAHIVGSASRLCRRDRADRRARRLRCAGGVHARLSLRLRRGLRLGRLFGALPPFRPGADRRGGRLLPRDRALEPRLPSRFRDHGVAGIDRAMACRSRRSGSARSERPSMSGTSA